MSPYMKKCSAAWKAASIEMVQALQVYAAA
jgi:hypothetical protein